MKLYLPPLIAFFTSFAVVSADGDGTGSDYLKENLTGRCYHNPPVRSGDEDCPTTVGALVGVLESKPDMSIQVSDFQSYVDKADFSSPKDKALFWSRFSGEEDSNNVVASPPRDLVAPEDTPGGFLMKDLVFCGVEKTSSCKKDESNAYWKFWQAAYSKFASQAEGHVQIVVEPQSDVQFVIKSAVSSMKKDQVTSVTVYGLDNTCNEAGPKKLVLSMTEAGFQGVSCDDDITDLTNDSSSSAAEKEEPAKDTATGEDAPPPKGGKENSPSKDASAVPMTTKATDQVVKSTKKRRHPFLNFIKWVFLLCVIAYAAYYLYMNGYIPSAWIRKVGGYETVNDANGDFQRVSANPEERLPLHSVDDNSSTDKKDGNYIPEEKVVIQ